MKKTLKRKTGLLFFSILALAFSRDVFAATTTVDVGPTSFDRRTGKWYLGADATSASSAQSVATVGPATADGTVTITDKVNESADTILRGKKLDLLHTVPNSTNTGTIVMAVENGTPTAIDSFVDTGTGTVAPTAGSATWLDANGDLTAGIKAIAARPAQTGAPTTALGHVFAAVAGNGGNFGVTTDGGLGIGSLTDAGVIVPKDATGNASTGDLVPFTGGDAWVDGGQAAAAVLSANAVKMVWSEGLKRLFVGVKGETTTAATAAMITVSAWSVSDLEGVADADYALSNVVMLTDPDGFGDPAAATTNYIIGCLGDGTNKSVGMCHFLDIMKTSTGHYYLIVQGGCAQIDTDLATSVGTIARNTVFALPLVGPDGDFPGALAAVVARGNAIADGNDLKSDPTRVNFNTRASGAAELLRQADTAANVGGGPLPITSTAAINCSGMQIVGDTVYCSTVDGDGTAGDTIQPGLHYSQAIFDDQGVIQAWTEWEKALPMISSGDAAAKGSCHRFAVDASRGAIFTIQEKDKQTIQQSYWRKDTAAATTYGGQVNGILDGPCYSHFLLHTGMLNFGNVNQTTNPENNYALFGGKGKVCGIIYGTNPNDSAAVTAVDKEVTDWDAGATAAVSCSEGLPANGRVTALGWTHKNSDAADNYILAGVEDPTSSSNTGLWALALTHATATSRVGFQTTTDTGDTEDTGVTNFLDSDTYSWYQLENVTGKVLKIISNAQQVAVILTKEDSSGSGATGTHKLYILNGDHANASVLNSTGLAAAAIVTTATGDLANVDRIHDMHWIPHITTDGDYSDDFYQLLLATDDGMYVSTHAGGFGATTTAALAGFKRIDSLAGHYGNMHTSLRGARMPATLWMSRDMRTPDGNRRSELCQMTTSINAYRQTLSPNSFTANDSTPDNIGKLPYRNSVATIGGMRFVIGQHHGRKKRKLYAAPWETRDHEHALSTVREITNTNIKDKNIYWVGPIGAGHIGAGTDDGLITLY